MEYRKERNFIVAYDGEKCRGKWDIIQNQYIGIKGNPVKNRPTAFCPNVLETVRETPCVSILRFISHWSNSYYSITQNMLARLEQIASVGLCINSDYSTLCFLQEDRTPLTKDCVEYLTNCNGGVYTQSIMESYKFYRKHKDFVNSLEDNKEWVCDSLRYIHNNLPIDFVYGMYRRAVHEKVFIAYTSSNFANMLNEWYDMVDKLNDKLEVKHNIITNFYILRWLYREYRDKHYDEVLARNNDKPFLYYEDDKYIVRPLLSRKEFHHEASVQNNCVERMFMEYVYNGRTHVVTVRKKSAPDEPYITCEVNTEGAIRQYLLKNNRNPQNDGDRLFRQMYQAHLNSSLKEQG